MVRSPPSLVDGGLALDAVGHPRQRLEPARSDGLAAAETPAIRAVGHSGKRGFDEPELLGGLVAQREVALLGEDLTGRGGLRSVGHLAGRLDGLAQLGEQSIAFGFQGDSSAVEIGRVHRATVPPAGPESLARISCPGITEGILAIAIDPVCGMEVDTTTSTLSLEYDGTTYWFCGKGCMLDFQEDPEQYLAPGYTPSMEPQEHAG